jgi:hypothetical protein
VDLFIKRDDPYDDVELDRRLFVPLSPDGAGLFVASPEDIVLRKLAWFRAGGEVSDSQARNVRGVLRVSSGRIDWQYLRRWAAHLGIDDLLERFADPSP